MALCNILNKRTSITLDSTSKLLFICFCNYHGVNDCELSLISNITMQVINILSSFVVILEMHLKHRKKMCLYALL